MLRSYKGALYQRRLGFCWNRSILTVSYQPQCIDVTYIKCVFLTPQVLLHSQFFIPCWIPVLKQCNKYIKHYFLLIYRIIKKFLPASMNYDADGMLHFFRSY